MSIEQKIEALTAAVTQLTAVLSSQHSAPVTAAPYAAIGQQSMNNLTGAVLGASPAAPAMPAPPSFIAPVAAPAPAPVAAAPAGPVAPFADGAGLINYVMGVYKQIGPVKGAQIQPVLVSLGYQNINDVKPEHYGALFAGIEALKG
jgi:hypothetical protein